MVIAQGRHPHSARGLGLGEREQTLPGGADAPAGLQVPIFDLARARRPRRLPRPGTVQNRRHGGHMRVSAAMGAPRA